MRRDYFEPMTTAEVEAELKREIELAITARADLIAYSKAKADAEATRRIEAMSAEDFLSKHGKAMIERLTGNIPKPLPVRFGLGITQTLAR